MWTFHPSVGFFSAVIDRQKPGNILVRFRDPSHAEAFVALAWKGRRGRRAEIKETPQADYRWKASITAERFVATTTALADAVDYDNFKGRCAKTPLMQSVNSKLHDVWHVMHRHQCAIVERRVTAERAATLPAHEVERPLFDDWFPTVGVSERYNKDIEDE